MAKGEVPRPKRCCVDVCACQLYVLGGTCFAYLLVRLKTARVPVTLHACGGSPRTVKLSAVSFAYLSS